MAHRVRQATLLDLEQLAPLFDRYRQFYGRASDVAAAREFLLARFTSKESTLLIAHEDERPVGFTQLYPSFSSVSLARIFILNDLFVSEQARRNGVASALMSAAVKFASTLGAVRLSLSTATTNDAAQAHTTQPVGSVTTSSSSTILLSRHDLNERRGQNSFRGVRQYGAFLTSHPLTTDGSTIAPKMMNTTPTL